jgi:peroxiredoxin
VLTATTGSEINVAEVSSAGNWLVVYVDPQTGVPGQPVPPGWDDIPGARGCTSQSCAYRDGAPALADLGASVFGLSGQSLDQQREFAEREHLPYPLLNDSAFRLAEELGYPPLKRTAPGTTADLPSSPAWPHR